MATPMVAGEAALIRSKNTGWTPEQVKADIMNTAGQDLYTDDNHSGLRYAPNRVGAGRIDVKAALDNKVLAYVTDDPGEVTASFGPVAATAPMTLTKTIKLDNQGSSDETYDASYVAITTVPGASYSVSPSQVTVAAHSSATVTLTLSIDPAKLVKTMDPTVATTQSGLPREFLADASGRVVFAPGDGTPNLRVPVYSAPRPASTMTQPASLDMSSGATQTASMPLSGNGVSQGSGSRAIQSLVSGFELQATSPALPACGVLTSGCIHASDELGADLKYVGTTSNAPELSSIGDDPLAGGCNADGQCGLEYFAISTQGPWHTAATENEYDIYIDSNGDGNPDYVAFNTRLAAGTDLMGVNLLKLSTGQVVDQELINDRFGNTDTALFDSDTLVMPVWLPALGVSVGHSRITYAIVTFGSFTGNSVDSVGFDGGGALDGSLTTDVLNPGVAVFGSFDGSSSALLYADMPSTSLTVQRDTAAYAADNGHGVLMVHYHNVTGNKAQVVDIDSHSLTVSKSGNGSGSVTSSPAGIDCGGTCTAWFASGSSVTLTATPASGSTFTGWSGGGCSGTGVCMVTMDAATSVTADFTLRRTLTVSKSGNGTGSVTSSPAGISCGATCSATYDGGTVVNLTATPAATSSFAGWSGACSGTGACMVTMDAARSVTATFTDLPPTVTSVTVTVSTSNKAARVIFAGNDPGNPPEQPHVHVQARRQAVRELHLTDRVQEAEEGRPHGDGYRARLGGQCLCARREALPPLDRRVWRRGGAQAPPLFRATLGRRGRTLDRLAEEGVTHRDRPRLPGSSAGRTRRGARRQQELRDRRRLAALRFVYRVRDR